MKSELLWATDVKIGICAAGIGSLNLGMSPQSTVMF